MGSGLPQDRAEGDRERCHAHHAGSTFEPLGVVFNRAQGRAVTQAAIDDGVDGQEICHCGCEEHPPCTGDTSMGMWMETAHREHQEEQCPTGGPHCDSTDL